MDARPSCMLVEDEALIAMAIEATLEEAGFVVTGTFATGARALRWLEHNSPQLAVIDVVLRDGPALNLARVLKQRGIPFAVYSGLRRTPETPELQDVPWLEKPMSRHALTHTLQELAGAARHA